MLISQLTAKDVYGKSDDKIVHEIDLMRQLDRQEKFYKKILAMWAIIITVAVLLN